jgi:predicted ABC-type ATPase
MTNQQEKKQLWLLAGGNGAGKSTFYKNYLEPRGIHFVNADNIARDIAPDSPEIVSYDASKIAKSLRANLLKEEVSFCFETVFSHPSKIDFVAEAKALGYEIILVFIHLDNSELNKARVQVRVEQGGHNVPQDKIEQRIPRTLNNIKATLPLVDEAHFLDNSSYVNPFQIVAVLRAGQLSIEQQPLPEWATTMLSEYLLESAIN